jgi:drug/metabolite transporter (DMT)-like permease
MWGISRVTVDKNLHTKAILNMNILKSIGAVLAGAIVGVVLSVGTDAALRAADIFTPLGQPMSDALLLLATFYRAVYGVLGSYVTARLAPNRPMMHALILGAIGVAACIAGVVVAWNRVAEFGPRWYPVALVVLAMPQSWLGAKLRVWQLQARPADSLAR